MNDPDPTNSRGFWESKFCELVLTSADKADKRARSSLDPAYIIENMDTKRILMQYGTDLLHMIYGIPLDDNGRERLFEAVSHNMLGTLLAGRLGAGNQHRELQTTTDIESDVRLGRNKTGPAPIKRDFITAKILESLRLGEDLAAEKQEALTARFGGGASRGTVKAAFDQAMSMLVSENSDRVPSDNDKL